MKRPVGIMLCVGLLALFVMLCGCGGNGGGAGGPGGSSPVATAGKPPGPTPASGNRIVFSQYSAARNQIFVMNPDGSAVTQLTSTAKNANQYPSWSPGQVQIAFNRLSGVQPLVFVMDADGSNAHQLATGAHPDFHPDGKRVAFAKVKNTYWDQGIYEVDLTGKVTDLVVDLSTSPYDYDDFEPRWSPDGTKLAFRRDTWQGNDWVRADLYVADFGTSAPTSPPASLPTLHGPFGVAGAQANQPGDWSPDGTCIAFCSYSASGWSTYIMSADGSNLSRVCAGGRPAWSPDGKSLAFCLGISDGISRVLVDGTGLIQLTNKGSSPDW